MIDLKAIIYSALSTSSPISAIVGDNIHIFSDDTDEIENFDSRLPQITYARIVGKPTRIGVKNEIYQISAWGKTPAEAETLSQKIIELFNRTQNASWRYCDMELVNDSFDAQTEAYGVHITLKFTVYDPTY